MMKKKSYLIYVLLILTIILGACGTSNDQNKSSSGASSDSDNDNSMEENDETDGEDTSDLEEKEDDEEANENDQEDTDEGKAEDEEEDFLAEAEVKKSDAQDYSIAVLPNYTLTSEEPGRDSLYLTEDGTIFMRIETVPFDQEGYDFFKENAMEMLQGMAAEGETVETINEDSDLPSGEGVENQVGYTVKTDEIYMSGIVFSKGDLLVRLTIFDSADQAYFNDFLRMGETIKSN